MDVSKFLCMYTSWVFTYHTADFLRGSEQVRRNILFVAKSEIAVLAFFAFLAGAIECLSFSRTNCPPAYDDNEYRIRWKTNERACAFGKASVTGVVFIDVMGVSWWVEGTRYTADLSYFYLVCVRAIDWSRSHARYWYYDFSTDNFNRLRAGRDSDNNDLVAEEPVWLDGSVGNTRAGDCSYGDGVNSPAHDENSQAGWEAPSGGEPSGVCLTLKSGALSGVKIRPVYGRDIEVWRNTEGTRVSDQFGRRRFGRRGPLRWRGARGDGVGAECYRLGIGVPENVGDALTQTVLWVCFFYRSRDLEAREATIAGRIKGERLTEVRKGA